MLKIISIAAALVVAASPVSADSLSKVSYAPASITPNHVPQSVLDRNLVDFFRAWKALYIKQACGPGRFIVKVDADHKPVGGGTKAGTITVSEAHGYGMMLMTMMASVDPEAHDIFDGMVLYLKDHPAKSNPALLAWNQIADCSDAPEVTGDNSATDGDLDIAYALLLADKVWGSKGKFNYRVEAEKVLYAILDKEVDSDANYLLVGDWAGSGEDATYAATTRSSDFMVSHLKAFANATGDTRWIAIRDRTYSIMDSIRTSHSKTTGLMPDFIVNLPDNPKPAPAGFLEGPNDGDYSWNAARYPWRIGLDYLINGDARARSALVPLNAWAQSVTGGIPARFADTYRLNGKTRAEHGSNQMAYVPMLGVAAMIDPVNQKWLNAIWDTTVAKPLSQEDYYGNTLKLLAMVTMSGHWLSP